MRAMRCLLFQLLSISAFVYGQQRPFLSPVRETAGTIHKFDLTHLTHDILALAEIHDLDIWHVSASQAHIFIPANEQAGFGGLPKVLQEIPHEITSIPVPLSPLSLSTSPGSWNVSSLANTTYHSSYHPLYEIDLFIRQLAEVFPSTVELVELGHSATGREMMGVKISSNSTKRSTRMEEARVMEGAGEVEGRKPPKRDRPGKERELDPEKKLGFVIIGPQHAREWVATSTALYLAHALAVNTSETQSLASLLDIYDFYVVPSPNPDGYTFTWEGDRFWYKNRQMMGPKGKCIGLDMNRNWGYKWKPWSVGEGEGFFQSNDSVSDNSPESQKKKKPKRPPADPCSHWYPGHRAFEAPEVNNIANWVGTLPNLVGLLELRAYGQMLSTPFSYSCNRWPADLEDQTEAALGAVSSLKNVHGTDFQTGQLCAQLYTAPGNMIDWMYKRLGIKYSYVAHLRDTGTYGFSLPSEMIRPVGEETSAMLSMPGLSRVLAKLAVHGQLLLIYPAAFETREERLTNYEFPSDLPYEDVEITTSDRVQLKCILLRAEKRSRTSVESSKSSRARRQAPRPGPRATVIMFHGNGYHIWHHAYSGAKFVELGCDVLLVSYRGYGHSEGTPSEKGIQRDSQAGLDYVLSHPELKKRPIIVHGHSLGGAVSIDLAHRNPDKIHGLIVENTFLSIPAVAKDLPGIRHLTFAIHQTWESQRRIACIPRSIPILMFSGSKDEVVPAAQMQKLWEISRSRQREVKGKRTSVFSLGSRFWKKQVEENGDAAEEDDNVALDVYKTIPEGTHADTWIMPGYWDTVDEFLTKLTKLEAQD
ncbi:hypothetical protein V5O48_014833 [Marasmius crinis-equi]|uniref:Inactive metallocarboxypeptidase ECM14 n=1 Tax=Marasmius crinis-equi TaxID=585013 RepID=A0ABR3EW95_9AGAR